MLCRQDRLIHGCLLAALCSTTYGCFLTGPSRLTPSYVAVDTPLLPPVPATNSQFTMPLSIPIQVLQNAIENAIPRTFDDSDEYTVLNLPGSTFDVTVGYWWDVTRDSIRITDAQRSTLDLTTRATGKVGLDDIPGITVGLRLNVESRPRLRTNWDLEPNYSVDVEIMVTLRVPPHAPIHLNVRR